MSVTFGSSEHASSECTPNSSSMAEADQLVTSMEDEFWKSFMPAGTASSAEMAVDQSAGRKPDETQGPKDDDGRGGKWAKDNRKGKGRTQQSEKADRWRSDDGHGRGGGGGRWPSKEKEYRGTWRESEVDGVKRQLASVQRLLLRHEDAINTQKAEYSFVLHLRINVPSTIVPSLSKARTGWHALRQEKPAEVTRPMRVALWTCGLQEWLARLVALPSVPATQTGVEKLGWFDIQKNAFLYVQWHAESQQLVTDQTKEAIPYEQGKTMLQELIKVSVSAGVIARFFPTRPLAAEMRGESVTFLLQLCARGNEAEKAHEILGVFCGSACSLLIGMQVKPDRGTRNGLAQAISKEIPA